MAHTVTVLNVWVFRTRPRWFTASRNANYLKTSISKPSALGWQFLRGSPEAVEAFREFRTLGSDVKLKAMENEQTGLAHSLPLSPEHVYVNSPVEFAHEYLFPSPEARNIISFRLDNMLFTAGSDSEDFGPALADALPPSGQKARPSAAYS